jgi:hypothetical protein
MGRRRCSLLLMFSTERSSTVPPTSQASGVPAISGADRRGGRSGPGTPPGARQLWNPQTPRGEEVAIRLNATACTSRSPAPPGRTKSNRRSQKSPESGAVVAGFIAFAPLMARSGTISANTIKILDRSNGSRVQVGSFARSGNIELL